MRPGDVIRRRAWFAPSVPLLLAVALGCGGGTISGQHDGSSGDGGVLPDGAALPDGADGGVLPDGADGGGVNGDAQNDATVQYGAELFVATAAGGGDDGNAGTRAAPFATLERARTAVRELVAGSLPAGGVVVWLRGGRYERTATFVLGTPDSGEEGKPVVYRGYPGETARLVGGRVLDPSWFTATTSASPVWGRVDTAARGHLVQVDLGAHGIADFGTLEPRGFGTDRPAALELFFDGAPMTLGRWPDASANDPPATYNDDTVVVYGNPTPDVTGTYVKSGTQDGVNAYARQGLVGGKQYNLHRHTWVYQGNTYTAWFITTAASGYPPDTDPWWHRYNPNLGPLDAGTGAAGAPTTVNPNAVNHGFVSIDRALSDTAFTYLGTRPSRWTQAPDLWLHGYWKYMWADLHTAVASVDTGTSTVTLPAVPGYGLAAGQPYYAENLLEEITEPGEWYLDRASGILYFWPPADLASGEAVVSTLAGPLVRLGDASHVWLQDLVLEVSRARLVEITGGAHNRVFWCTLRNAGTDAAAIAGTDNGLERCEVAHSGDTGVSLSGGDRASLAEAGNFVRSCDIHHYGRWSWTYQPAVLLSGAGHVVAHNRLHQAPHTAVLFSGNEHTIEYNDIHEVCQFSSDAGAIYTGRDWGYRGNVVRHNFIHHVSSWFEGFGVHGVYLDDCVSGIEVTGNVIYRVSGHAIQHGGGRDDLMTNNVMARCGDALAADNRGLVWINNTPGSDWNMLERLTYGGIQYQAEPWQSAYPALYAVPNDWAVLSASGSLWLYPEGSVFSRNLGFANGDFTVEGNWVSGTTTFDKYAEMADNIADQDPLFVDEANLDLTLRPESPAFTIPGFQAIPFHQIGIEP
jgi:hypothetical protein